MRSPARWLASARGGVDGTVEYAGAERRWPLASAIARLPLPPSVGAGARLALEPGHGRTATPVRSAVIGLSIAVAAMVAAFGFSASMDHFGRHAVALSGFDFDFGAGQPFAGRDFQDGPSRCSWRIRASRTWRAGNFQQFVVAPGPGRRTSQEAVWGLETIKGPPVTTTMLEGRWPHARRRDRARARDRFGARLEVGDRVTVPSPGRHRELTIVGDARLPRLRLRPGSRPRRRR